MSTVHCGQQKVSCPPPARPESHNHWALACNYTEASVRQQLPRDDFVPEETVVILLSDGQSGTSQEGSFSVQDQSLFPVQIAMMMQSDYHFGNPASSIDYVLSHWRQGKPTFPDSCFQAIQEHYYTLSN